MDQDLGRGHASSGPPGTAPVPARLAVNVTLGGRGLLVYFYNNKATTVDTIVSRSGRLYAFC